ncbi:MAG: GntR family transcriptional regulator [Desulfitobacteriaceae bacterium]
MGSIIKNMPFHLQVYQIVRESILTGKRRPGERLFEVRLAQEMGVSRSPVREAMRMLEQDGLVITTESSSIVNPMEIGDMEEIYQCRIATEPYAGFLAANKMSPEKIAELAGMVEQAEEAHKQGNYELVVELNTAFHDLIVGSSGNRRLCEIVDKIRSLIILARNAELRTYLRPSDYLDEHREIVNGLREGDPAEVESVLKKHIENDWQYYMEHYQASQVEMEKETK